MAQKPTVYLDPIVEEVHRVREEQIAQHGGIDGYFKHLEEMDRAYALKSKRRAAKIKSTENSSPSQPKRTKSRQPKTARTAQ